MKRIKGKINHSEIINHHRGVIFGTLFFEFTFPIFKAWEKAF